MQERLLNQFPNPSTVKYSEISVSFNGTRTNKLGAIRNRWLKTYCGAVDGKNIPLRKQPLKNFIQKFCASYGADKHWEDPHSPIAVEEVPLAVQRALPTMLQVAVWPLGPVKEEVPLILKVEEGQCLRPNSIQPSRRRRAPAPSPTTPYFITLIISRLAVIVHLPSPSHPFVLSSFSDCPETALP